MLSWFSATNDSLLFDTATIFVVGLLFALLVRQIRQSPLIGYLIAGLIIGPHGLRLVPDEANIRFLADVGVIFLMFALGVQLSLRQLLAVKITAIFGGLLQIILLISIGIGIGRIMGLSPGAGIVLGYALALSSSVVLVRLLGDTDEFQTSFGRIALGISVMQDLMAVILISTLPFLEKSSFASYTALSANLGKSVLFIIWAIILARWVAPIILKWASSTGSREIFLPTVAVLSIGGAMMSELFGFSYALGAFLSGLVISESLFNEAVLAEIIPLRDLFGMLFFVSLGMLVDPVAIVHSGVILELVTVVAILGKGLIIFLIVLLFRNHPYTALMTGACLAQVGEFSFIIAREAESMGVIDARLNSLILSVAIISIIITPIILPVIRWLYHFVRVRGSKYPVESAALAEMEREFADGIISVLLCGYGRVGRTIAQALDTFRIPFLVIDYDRHAVEDLHRRGIQAIYGDTANKRLLEHIGVNKFQMAVIAIPEQSAVRIVLQNLRQLNPGIRLLLRSHTDTATAQYLAMGVEGVVHVELEASLAFIREVLTTADVDTEIVAAYLEDIRIGYYEGLMPRRREE
ncbi:MAG TPA: cation:proton antiporter [Armatimonadota bacterium]|nr:cation:proton antiporter [Armatimonadota bacterium]